MAADGGRMHGSKKTKSAAQTALATRPNRSPVSRKLKSGGDLATKILRLVGIDETFPYNMPGIRGDFFEVGLGGSCDPSMANLRTRQTVFRHAMGCLVGEVAGAGAAITFAEQSVVLFENGNLGATTGLGNTNLTAAETNAEADGGIAKGFSQFVLQAVGIAPVQPWFSADGSEPIEDIQQPQWLRDPNVNYGAIAQRMAFDLTSMEITNGDDACDYDLGPLSLWAQMSGVAEVRNGFGGFGGAMWYFATPQVSGSAQSNEQLTITATLNRAFSVPNAAAIPTVAGQVIIPFRFVGIGFPQCLVGTAEAKVDALAAAMQAFAKKNGLPMPTEDEIEAFAVTAKS